MLPPTLARSGYQFFWGGGECFATWQKEKKKKREKIVICKVFFLTNFKIIKKRISHI
jgi:hypothetical protein